MTDLERFLEEFHTLISLRDAAIEELHSVEADGRALEKQSLDEAVKAMYRKTHIDSFIEANKSLISILKELEEKVRLIKEAM